MTIVKVNKLNYFVPIIVFPTHLLRNYIYLVCDNEVTVEKCNELFADHMDNWISPRAQNELNRLRERLYNSQQCDGSSLQLAAVQGENLAALAFYKRFVLILLNKFEASKSFSFLSGTPVV